MASSQQPQKEQPLTDLDFLADLARKAGAAILAVYGTDFNVKRKEDRSPLTLADTQSHAIISAGLRARYPQIPVLSEEGKEVPYAVRKTWPRFWLVDPLDGTKEFVKRNGEFTVNIALIEGTSPVLGLIYIPVQDLLYVADTRQGCWEISNGKRRKLQVAPPPTRQVRVIKSRSHPSPKLEALLQALPNHAMLTRGSALKFCSIARGDADFYPRLNPTWEWDTAAGQAIVMAAGGVVVDFDGNAFTYNKENLINGPFLVTANFSWLQQAGLLQIARDLAQRD